MNTKLLGLLAAAALATAACQQDKKTETTTPEITTTTTTTTTAPDTLAYRTDARHLADRVATDLALTDPTVKRRLENTYYTRASRLGELQTHYTADTTGRYQALRMANDQADEEVRTSLNNPTYYKTYSANRAQYGDGPYSLAPTATTAAPVAPAAGGRHTGGVGQGTAVKKLENKDDYRKTKYENGAKVKVKDDGARKIKMADGTKVKIDEDGNRTVKKGLFH